MTSVVVTMLENSLFINSGITWHCMTQGQDEVSCSRCFTCFTCCIFDILFRTLTTQFLTF